MHTLEQRHESISVEVAALVVAVPVTQVRHRHTERGEVQNGMGNEDYLSRSAARLKIDTPLISLEFDAEYGLMQDKIAQKGTTPFSFSH